MEKLEESFIITLIILEHNIMLIIAMLNCVCGNKQEKEKTQQSRIRVMELCVHNFLREKERKNKNLVRVGKQVSGWVRT